MGHTIDSLQTGIEKLFKKSTDERYFVNPHDLKALLTRDVIAKAIEECVQEHAVPVYQKPHIVNRIFIGGRIVFGILIWRKWQHKLMSFIEHDALDSQLPLDVARAEKVAGTLGWNFAVKTQWQFLPRMLKKEMSEYHCHFHDEEILPFIDETFLGEGAFGEVSKMVVVPSLQTIFSEPVTEVFVVRKRLREDRDLKGLFLEREIEFLRILNNLRHPNIVQLLGSYTHCGRHFFLFPLFRMDLERFLQLKDRPGDFGRDSTFYIALEGLSSALEKIHSLNLNTTDHGMELKRIGYHHDVRPANVLVDHRTFYLADFGLARIKPEDANSRTKWKFGLGDYVGPECMNEKFLRQEVGRPLDIWSFGCMVSEIAAYIKDGPNGVADFQKQRLGHCFRKNITDRWFFSGNSLRMSVISWFEDFKMQSESGVLRDLLETSSFMLKIDPAERPKAAEVHQQMSFLSVKALFDAVQQALTKYLRVALEQGKIGASRLSAWGKALQLTGGGDPLPQTIETVSNSGDRFRRILTTLLGKLDLDVRADEAETSSVVTSSIRKPLHEELQELIEQLWNSVPPGRREKLRQLWLEDSLVASPSHETLHNIESSSKIQKDPELGSLASTKLEALHLKNNENRASESESLLLHPDLLFIEKPFDEGLAVGRYGDKQVLVEWVSHEVEWKEISEPERQQRMQLMAEVFHLSPKPSSSCVLDCLGFALPTLGTPVHDYGFVYTFPTLTPRPLTKRERMAPICLCDILKSRDKRDLPLGERFRLAYRLVCCVRELHIARWLHKNISSRNIVFFEEEGGDSTLSDVLRNPYLINFRHSRRSGKESQTEIYLGESRSFQYSQHPDYSISEQHFRDIYDYYSLGIVLLEIGGWTPLENYVRHSQSSWSSPSAFRDELVSKYAPRLSHLMGATYTDITLACLRCDFDQDEIDSSRGVEGQTVPQKFYDKVVSPLGDLARRGI